MTAEILVTDTELNQMNQVLFEMRALKRGQKNPVFSIEEIVEQWHLSVDAGTSVETITAILESGASTGFFLFYQCLNGTLFYGYNRNMLRLNKKNLQILEAAPSSEKVCLDPCNMRLISTCISKTPVPSNCCFTQWKGTVAGGSISSVCGASMETALFMCADQQTCF